MPYQVMLHHAAADFLKKCPPGLRERIKKKLHELGENPLYYLEHFEGDYYKLRIGDYRALIDADFENKILKIRVLDHRSRIYRR